MSFPDCITHDLEQRSDEWFKARSGKLTGSKMGAWLADVPKNRLTIADLKKELTAEGVTFEKTAKRDDLVALISHPDKFLTETEATISARKTAVYKVLGDMSGCPTYPDFEVDASGPPPRSATAFSIWRGINLEPYAKEEFERITRMKVDEVGFCSSRDYQVGVSPDGKIFGFNTGWETKSPDPHVHIKYFDKGELPEQYAPQVHGSMAVTGAESWWFMSYCPRWRWREDLKEIEILSGGLPPLLLEIGRDETTERYLDGFNAFQDELDRQSDHMAELWEDYQEGGAK